MDDRFSMASVRNCQWLYFIVHISSNNVKLFEHNSNRLVDNIYTSAIVYPLQERVLHLLKSLMSELKEQYEILITQLRERK